MHLPAAAVITSVYDDIIITVELGGCHSTSEKQVHESTDNIDGLDSMIHKNSLSAHAAHGQDMLAGKHLSVHDQLS